MVRCGLLSIRFRCSFWRFTSFRRLPAPSLQLASPQKICEYANLFVFSPTMAASLLVRCWVPARRLPPTLQLLAPASYYFYYYYYYYYYYFSYYSCLLVYNSIPGSLPPLFRQGLQFKVITIRVGGPRRLLKKANKDLLLNERITTTHHSIIISCLFQFGSLYQT